VVRNATLASLLGQEMIAGLLGSATPALRFNEHIEADGPTVFQHACKLGLKRIVSKRKDSYYVSGRSLYWIKSKNPNAPAVKPEEEVDWGSMAQKGQPFETTTFTSSGSKMSGVSRTQEASAQELDFTDPQHTADTMEWLLLGWRNCPSPLL
jgi:hypothetical protein